MTSYRSHNLSQLRKSDAGQTVKLAGWINKKRDLGDLIFIDLRDRYGVTQLVIDRATTPQIHAQAEKLHQEDVLSVTGVVRVRSAGNAELATGEIEVLVQSFDLLSVSKNLPFDPTGNTIADELRLKFRYLDLRRKKMQKNLELRHQFVKLVRDFLDRENFLEIETPMLVKGTPEGSREFMVPSRLHPGSFYVLPQSPQQMKQLLMVAGMDKYFQVVRCFRDEDLRGDRQPEFTQLDLEMSFVTQEEIMDLNERMIIEITQKLVPEKKIMSLPFPRLSYRQAMDEYGSDKPDIRFELKIQDVSTAFTDTDFAVFKQVLADQGVIKAIKVPQYAPGRSFIDNKLLPVVQAAGAKGLIWLQATEEGWQSSVEKYLSVTEKAKLKELLAVNPGDLVLVVADKYETAVTSLGKLRLFLGAELKLTDPNLFAYLWVTEFPLFEKSDEGEIVAVHHPFTTPYPEDIPLLDKDPFNIRSNTYDIVLNGCELGGGSIRIHDRELQDKIFEVLGVSGADKERRFGHILEAFSYGVPPHGGIAWGLDRFVMFFAGEDNIREVIAFPKNNKAEDLMFGAPADMPEQALKEVHIAIK